jgi:hypothetical protein
MKQKALWLIALAAAASVPVLAQSNAPDTISLLLAEVRQLRLALERTAWATPQIQLLGARLTVQNDRLARVTAEHDSARRELEEVSAGSGELVARLQAIELAKREAHQPDVQRQIDQQEAEIKQEIGALSGREQRLRAREAELAAAVGAEQSQWFELNRRLDELERALNAR